MCALAFPASQLIVMIPDARDRLARAELHGLAAPSVGRVGGGPLGVEVAVTSTGAVSTFARHRPESRFDGITKQLSCDLEGCFVPLGWCCSFCSRDGGLVVDEAAKAVAAEVGIRPGHQNELMPDLVHPFPRREFAAQDPTGHQPHLELDEPLPCVVLIESFSLNEKGDEIRLLMRHNRGGALRSNHVVSSHCLHLHRSLQFDCSGLIRSPLLWCVKYENSKMHN